MTPSNVGYSLRRWLSFTILSVFIVSLALAGWPAPAAGHGSSGGAGVGDVDPVSGAYGTSLSIEVPPFHGLEPKLGLSYSSGAGNGWLGVGWSLSGLSLIERASPGGGAPRWDGTDIYQLDGTDLIACTTLGGTHCPERQSFQRVVRVTTNNGDSVCNSNCWYVLSGTGITSTYTPLYAVGANIYRWALKTVEDPRGNTVTYNYWCDPGQNCYLDNITYTGAKIIFYRELRPDPMSFANGNYVGGTNFRLKAIDVLAGAVNPSCSAGVTCAYRARTYQFNYTNSASTGRSLLASVQTYGRDAVLNLTEYTDTFDSKNTTTWAWSAHQTVPFLDGSNNVVRNTGTGADFAANFERVGFTLGHGQWLQLRFKVDATNTAAHFGIQSDASSTDRLAIIADQGKIYTQYRTAGGAWVLPKDLINPVQLNTWYVLRLRIDDVGGFELQVYQENNALVRGTYHVNMPTGKSWGFFHALYRNTAYLDAYTEHALGIASGTALPAMNLSYSTASLWFTANWAAPVLGNAADANHAEETYFTGDFNGDGRQDLAYRGTGSPQVLLATGTGFGAVQSWGSFGSAGSTSFNSTGDFNGDGNTDFIKIHDDDRADVALSTGSTFQSYNFGTLTPRDTTLLGDFNGDGKTDVAYGGMLMPTGGFGLRVAISTGSGFSLQGWGITYASQPADYASIERYLAGDFNGDGRTDISHHSSSGLTSVFLSTGNTFNAGQNWGSWVCNMAQGSGSETPKRCLMADFNGDGKADLLHKNAGADMLIALSNGKLFEDTLDWTPNYFFGANPLPPSTAVARYRLGDFNGDGRSDIFYVHSDSKLYVARSHGEFFTQAFWGGPWGGAGTDEEAEGRYQAADFNGDGKDDLLYLGSDSKMHVALAGGGSPDLLTNVANGLGATTAIAYTPSSAWPQTFLPVGMVLQTVSSVTTCSGRDSNGDGAVNTGDCGSLTYTYSGANWSSTAKSFLGFRYVKTILDGAGNYSEIYNRQSVAASGMPEVTYHKNSAGQIYEYRGQVYAEVGNGTTTPYSSLKTEAWRFTCNLTNTCRRTLQRFYYDVYGNLYRTEDYGAYIDTNNDGVDEAIGDERTSSAWHYPNAAGYLVKLPGYKNVFRCVGCPLDGTNLIEQTLFEYDNSGNYTTPPTLGSLTRQRAWNNQTGGHLNTTFVYDTWGNQLSSTDPRGSTSTTDYDATYHLYPTETCNALNQCTTQVWDYVLGLATSSTDANGAVTSMAYDALGRMTSQTTPNPTGSGTITTQYQYLGWLDADWNNNRVRTLAGAGTAVELWSDNYTDGLGRTFKVVKEGPSAGVEYIQETLYSDPHEQVWKQSLWYATGGTKKWTTYSYDGLGRMTQTLHPDGNDIAVQYKISAKAGNPSCGGTIICGDPWTATYDELGYERITWHNAYGQLIQTREKNAAGTAACTAAICFYTIYQYDQLGNLVRSVDALGNTNILTYTSLGWKTAMTDVDMGHWTYTYDNGGLLLTQTDAKNQTFWFKYDALGRMTEKRQTNSTGLLLASWFYDETGYGASKGRLTRVTYPGGNEKHTYNSLGLETSLTQTLGTATKTTKSAYDALGRLSTLTYPDGEAVAYAYDPDGNLNSVSGYVSAMTWSAVGQLTAMTYTNGISATYTYNANREWLATAYIRNGATTRYQATYGYDAAGQVLTMTQGTPSNLTTYYTYDALNRLVGVSGAQNQSFTYNAIGNLMSNSLFGGAYTYGPSVSGCSASTPTTKPHAVKTANGKTYTYDCNGNVTNDGVRAYTWDSQNRLTQIVSGTTTTTFTYGPGEQRLQKISGGVTTNYFSNLVEQVGTTDVQYYYAGPILVAKKEGANKTFYHADRLGSIRLLTNSTGGEAQEYNYQPFGTQSGSGSATNERGFTGHRTDAETGLIYMVARYQDPALGRFLAADTIVPDPADPQTLNRYSYAGNNPIANTDPTGHTHCDALCRGTGVMSLHDDMGGGGSSGGASSNPSPEALADAQELNALVTECGYDTNICPEVYNWLYEHPNHDLLADPYANDGFYAPIPAFLTEINLQLGNRDQAIYNALLHFQNGALTLGGDAMTPGMIGPMSGAPLGPAGMGKALGMADAPVVGPAPSAAARSNIIIENLDGGTYPFGQLSINLTVDGDLIATGDIGNVIFRNISNSNISIRGIDINISVTGDIVGQGHSIGSVSFSNIANSNINVGCISICISAGGNIIGHHRITLP